jgi:branched-chain amino acid aminotransferase
MNEYAYINGQIIPIAQAHLHVTDLGILRGYGVFDFFRAIDGKPIYLEEHLDRFENSTQKMNLTLPYSRENLRNNVLDMIRLHEHKLLGIKLLCTGGYSEDGYEPATPNVVMLAKPFKMLPDGKTLKLMTVEHVRELSDIKTTNYIVPIKAIPQLKAGGFDDVLYHKDGLVSESSRSNVFIVKGEKVITPKSNILHGITRNNVIKVIKNHFDFEEKDFSLSDLLQADEVFISSSTKRVSPVEYVDNQQFTQKKVCQKIVELLIQNEI